MIRILSLLGILGALVYILFAWGTSGPGTPNPPQGKDRGYPGIEKKDQPNGHSRRPPGNASAIAVDEKNFRAFEPLVVPDVRVSICNQQCVSCERPGSLYFLGIEVPKDSPIDPRNKFTAKTYFIAKLVTSEEMAAKPDLPTFKIQGDNRVWRRWEDADSEFAEPEKMHPAP